jgi:hypothetical protein
MSGNGMVRPFDSGPERISRTVVRFMPTDIAYYPIPRRASEQRQRDGEAKCCRGFQVDNQLEPGGQLEWQMPAGHSSACERRIHWAGNLHNVWHAGH